MKPHRDPKLEALSKELLSAIGENHLADHIEVIWNPRLRTTAGRAYMGRDKVELNIRLHQHEGEIDRTLRHELAHLVAHSRTKGRRIPPHGTEWQKACADLGIAGESATHTLPWERTKQRRPYSYQCPNCKAEIHRTRPLKRPAACVACCRKYNGGKFSNKYLFAPV